MNKMSNCGDCGRERGSLHDMFCTKETCPFCFGQLASCRCIHVVLKLSDSESTAVDEYVDDFVDPLKTIIERWKDALNEKGRIPFGDDLKLLGIE